MHEGLVTILAKDSGLVLAGVILCFVAAIVAVILGVMDLVALDLIPGVIYLCLGLVCLIFTFRIYKRYFQTYAILLLIFSIIFLVAGYLALGTWGYLVGILMLIGVILLLVAKA
jgi:hypothetical protein